MAIDFSPSASDRLTSGYSGNTSTVTFSCWVNMDDPITNDRLARNSSFDLAWDQTGDGRFVFRAFFSTTQGRWRWTGIDAQLIGSWVHFAITYDNSSTANDPKLYLNGTLYTTGFTKESTAVGTAVTNTGLTTWGNADTANRPMDGKAQDFAIYNRILTTGELTQLAAGYSALFITNGLVSYIRGLNTGDIQDYVNGGSSIAGGANFAGPRLLFPAPIQVIVASTAGGPPVVKPGRSLQMLSGVGR